MNTGEIQSPLSVNKMFKKKNKNKLETQLKDPPDALPPFIYMYINTINTILCT